MVSLLAAVRRTIAICLIFLIIIILCNCFYW